MKINENYVYRKIAGEQILVPIGSSAAENGMFVLTELGGEIWIALNEGKSEEKILSELYSEYDVSYDELKNDVDAFIKKLTDKGIITDD